MIDNHKNTNTYHFRNIVKESRYSRALCLIPRTLDLKGSAIAFIVIEFVNYKETFKPY